MDERVIQFRVGVMVVATILIASILAIWFGHLPSYRTYTIYISFPEAPGVTAGIPIRKSGVKIGAVTYVHLNADRTVTVTAKIDEGRPLFKDEVCVVSPGLLGDATIEVTRKEKRPAPGELGKPEIPAQAEPVNPDETMPGEVRGSPARMVATLEEQLSGVGRSVKDASDQFRVASEKLSLTAQKVNELLDRNHEGIFKTIDQASKTFAAMQTLTESGNKMIGDEETQAQFRRAVNALPETLKQMQGTIGLVDKNLQNLEGFTGPLGAGGAERVARLDQAIGRLDTVMTQMESFSRSINDPSGSLGRLIKDPELYAHLSSAARNVNEVTQQLKPILNDARVFTDKIARHPESLGVRGAIQRSPGIK